MEKKISGGIKMNFYCDDCKVEFYIGLRKVGPTNKSLEDVKLCPICGGELEVEV